MDAIDRAHAAAPAPFSWDSPLEFAPRPDVARALRPQRLAATVGVVVLHVLFAWVLESQLRPREAEATDEVVVAVDFITALAPATIRPPDVESPAPAAPHATRSPRPARPRALPPRPIDGVVTAPAAPLTLYRPDGSLQLPDDVLADLERNAGDARHFDFEFPDLEHSGHRFDRPPALVYEATRFDQYWRPNESLLDEVLRKAVEKMTKEVRIPIPGAPGRELVCVVSMLAVGGGCVVERYGSDIPRPGIDDPATLDANEAAACQAWWDKIVATSTQSEWRRTRHRYDAECREPLAKLPNPPPEAQPQPAAQ
jgi:hypothetical protein